MNMDNLDPGTLGQDVPQFGQAKGRGWWSRNWLWFVPTSVLIVVLLGGGTIYWLLFAPTYNEVCRSAMQKIEADKELQNELGQPIRNAWWPPASGRIEERETEIRWTIVGPKGYAKAHVKARLMMGKWETVVLDAVLANGEKIAVREAGDTAAEAPLFEPPKPDKKKLEAEAPAPEINLLAPPADMQGPQN